MNCHKEFVDPITKVADMYIKEREFGILYGCNKDRCSAKLDLFKKKGIVENLQSCIEEEDSNTIYGTQLVLDDETIDLIIADRELNKSANMTHIIKEFHRVLKVLGIVVAVEFSDQSVFLTLFEDGGFRHLHSEKLNESTFLSVFTKTTSNLDKINFETLIFGRDQYYRDISQRLISKIISGFEFGAPPLIVDINGLNKLELTNVSIIRSITLFTKDSIENTKSILLKIKDEFKEIEEAKGIIITAKRVSQNRVLIFCPTIGFEIHIFNLFFDFDQVNSNKENKIPLMLEYSYHNLSYLLPADYEAEMAKVHYLEGLFFEGIEPLKSNSTYKPKIFINGIVIGLHRYGYEIGPIEIITTEDQKGKFPKDRYNLIFYKGDHILRGPFYEVYDLKVKRNIYRVYPIQDKCIPTDSYFISMKFLMCNFFLSRPVIKNLDLLMRACAGIVMLEGEKIPILRCIGTDLSDQYKFEVQIWEQPKWLFKIII